MLALGNRAHILVRPSVRDRLTWCLTDVFGCTAPVALNAPGLSEPILAFQFADGGSLSFEFSEEAPDEQQARRGAWLEVRVDDPRALILRVVEAGLERVRHPATDTFYVVIPGGQVIGIVPVDRASSAIAWAAPTA